MRHIAKPGHKFLIFCFRYNRIHKETSGIAFNLRIRKFLVTYVYYHVAELLCRRNLYVALLEFSPYIAIIKAWAEHF